MDRDNNDPGPSLSPVEVEAPSLALEAAALHKGNGMKLVGLTVGCALVIGVSVIALGDLDNRHTFVEAGTRMNALHEVGYERFWNCALIGMNQVQIQNADELETQLHRRAYHYGTNYAGLLRKCGQSLDSLERDLDLMRAPEPLKPQLAAMKEAVAATRHGLRELIDYVDVRGGHYDSELGQRYTSRLAIAWQQYRTNHAAFRETLREHLD
jgi:hypothetical protein